ncbi:peroxidase-like [Homalodisca vitripennis]|nr:peroxidase-like [Homalodisca vitripennis]
MSLSRCSLLVGLLCLHSSWAQHQFYQLLQNYSEFSPLRPQYGPSAAPLFHPRGVPVLNAGSAGGGYGLRPAPGNYELPQTDNALYGLPPHPLACGPEFQGGCQESKYRSIDGSCNNPHNPTWGMPNTHYGRLVPSKYSDGIHAPPVSVTGAKLPGSRLVSIVMFPDVPKNDPLWTLSSMSWGQIMTHDLSMAMGTTQAKAHSIQCCSPDGQIRVPEEYASPLCFPILIPQDDPVYSRYHQMCMNFVRSTTYLDTGCGSPHEPAEQLVAVTHYMDASFVYGSTNEVAVRLREGHGGLLRVDVRDNRPWPPAAVNKSAACDTQTEDEPCYQFGDVRGNQNPQLTVLQIVMLREHNRIATTLSHINPHWDDETLYQEARRILIAEYQHINYYEWLPIFLGKKNMKKYGLLYETHGYTDDYRPDVDPSALNGYATAAFRYFHSAIQGRLELIGEERNTYGVLRLSDFFNRPGIIEEGQNMDHLARGLTTQPEENIDPFFTSEITDYLFRNGKPFGRDLRATDIQRGRDHGLGSYNDYREFCGLPRAKTWKEFSDYITPENIEKLALLYASPDDVDLTVGGSVEAHAEDSLAGPTFLCLLLEQFYRTRVSDRFFFERGDPHTGFTPEQLAEIRKSSFSRLMCDNSDNVYQMQPRGFEVISHTNQLAACQDASTIPIVDLSAWKDAHGPVHTGPFYGKK